MYSTAHCLDNNDHQNEMATGNGRTATCNADHGLCTSKPIRDGNSTMEWNRMESNIQSCPSFACNSGLMMVKFLIWFFVFYFYRSLNISIIFISFSVILVRANRRLHSLQFHDRNICQFGQCAHV